MSRLDSLGKAPFFGLAQIVWVSTMSKEKPHLIYGALETLVLESRQHRITAAMNLAIKGA